MTEIMYDPEYELVPERPTAKRGRQCGKCGMKFDYGTGYGFYCAAIECPMGWNTSAGGQYVTIGSQGEVVQ